MTGALIREEIRTQTETKTKGKDGYTQAKERGFRRNQTFSHFDLGLPASRTIKNNNFCCSSHPVFWYFIITTLD